MVRSYCLVLAVALTLQAESPVRELMYGGPVRRPGEIVPLYDKGFLLYVHRPNRLEILRPGGQPSAFVDVPCPGTGSCSITGLAVDSAGTIAVGIGYLTPTGRGAGIRLLDNAGRELRFVGTGDYLPTTLCFDREDNLWSVGPERDPLTGADRPDYMLVRKFSSDGRELGRYLPRSLWPARKAQPARLAGGYWHLKAASDRIGIIIHERHGDNPAELVEWDLAGNLLSRTVMNDRFVGRVYSSDGRLYAQFAVPGTRKPELRVLDTKTGKWSAVADNLPDTPGYERAFLLGADGPHLVYSMDSRLILVKPGEVPR